MHDSERIPLEDDLRPAPGVPAAVLRGQVEVAHALQAAIINAAVEHDAICAFNFSAALSQVVDSIRSLSEVELGDLDITDIRHLVSEGVEAAFRERGYEPVPIER